MPIPYNGHWTAGEPQPAEADPPEGPRYGSVPYDVASLLKAIGLLHLELAKHDETRDRE